MVGRKCDVDATDLVAIPARIVSPLAVYLSNSCGMPNAFCRYMANRPYDFGDRSLIFARDVVSFARIVADRGYILGRLATQLVKAGASIGANLEESASGQTKPDFITKQCIALKESREARFWLRLIAPANLHWPPARSRLSPKHQSSWRC